MTFLYEVCLESPRLEFNVWDIWFEKGIESASIEARPCFWKVKRAFPILEMLSPILSKLSDEMSYRHQKSKIMVVPLDTVLENHFDFPPIQNLSQPQQPPRPLRPDFW